MAATDPEQAICIVKNRAGAYEILQALNDPIEGDTRVEKTDSENIRPQDFTIDTPGLTDVYTFQTSATSSKATRSNDLTLFLNRELGLSVPPTVWRSTSTDRLVSGC
jgi:hypothetical protein